MNIREPHTTYLEFDGERPKSFKGPFCPRGLFKKPPGKLRRHFWKTDIQMQDTKWIAPPPPTEDEE